MLVLLILLGTLSTSMASAAFIPKGTTAYAKDFIANCEGQQWFIDEVERLLNANQKTINNLNSSADLNVIKALGFADKNITGKIPKAIGELKELQYLFLNGNHLSGEIPAGLFALPKLKNIDLSGNNYAGAIPDGFGGMASLETLMLRGNAYTGTVPSSILSNTKLKDLDVSSNKLSGAMP